MKANNVVDNSAVEAAKIFSQELSKRPIEEQIAVSLISKNVLNGCSWEFSRANPEIRRNLEAFKNSKYCSVQEVTYNHQKKVYGYLIYMQMGKLLEILGPSGKGPLMASDLKIADQHRQEAIKALLKKLQAGYTGKMGIYCTNDSQTITVSGKAYPAYAVTLKELCTACMQANYGVVVSGAPRDPQQVLQREDAVLKSLVVAPSSNALFIDIAPMGGKRS